jgi:hypothetical protein
MDWKQFSSAVIDRPYSLPIMREPAGVRGFNGFEVAAVQSRGGEKLLP